MRNKGFTLIESLFVFSLVMLLAVLTVPKLSRKKEKPLDLQVDQISVFLEEAKYKSLAYHQKVKILFDRKTIAVEGGKKIALNEDCYFKNYHNFHFNNDGNINKGGHFAICNKKSCVNFIFHLGGGNFYVQS